MSKTILIVGVSWLLFWGVGQNSYADDQRLSSERLQQLQPIPWWFALGEFNGITPQQTYPSNVGWTLRGGVGSQIAVRLDGVPLLDSLHTTAPSRRLLTIDSNILQQLQLAQGPSSLYYGNHGFSGALSLTSQDVPRPQEKQSLRFLGRIQGSYRSADQSPEGHMALALSGQPGGVFLSGGAAYHGLRNPGGTLNPIAQTDFLRAHAMGKTEWRWGYSQIRGMFLFGQIDDIKYPYLFVPQSDVSRFRERRFLSYLEFQQRIPSAHTKLRFQASYQFFESFDSTQDVALGTRALRAWREALYPHHQAGIYAHGQSTVGGFLQLNYGAEWIFERLDAQILRATGTDSLLPSTVPQQAQRHQLAAYVDLQATFRKRPVKVVLEAGARIQPYWDDIVPTRGFAQINEQNTAHAARAGLRLEGTIWQWRLFYANGFRLPSWPERSAAGPQGDFFQLPPAQLSPEINHTFETRFDLRFPKRFHLSAHFYAQLWNGLIFLKPTLYQGNAQVNTLPVLQPVNYDPLLISIGSEARAWVRIWRGWSAKSSLAWFHLFDQPLTAFPQHIWPTQPELTASFQTRVDFGQWGGIEAYIQLATQQETRYAPTAVRLQLSQQRPIYALWTTINIRANLQLSRYLQLVANLQHLINQPYFTYGSTIYAPGVNYQFFLRAQY